MSTFVPERMQLLTLLARWRDGLIDEAEVQETAEALLDQRQEIEEIAHEDARSVVIEVLRYLGDLPALLVCRQDIGAIVDFLNTPEKETSEGWRKWLAYWDSVDEAKRRRDLSDHPFYFT